MAGLEGKRALEVGFPLTVNSAGRLADPDYEHHVEQMIELVLFTDPGERVNRPDFGCGLLRLIQEASTDPVASAVDYLIRGALQKWLGDVIAVRQVEVTPVDSSMRIRLAYIHLLDQRLRVVTFEPRTGR